MSSTMERSETRTASGLPGATVLRHPLVIGVAVGSVALAYLWFGLTPIESFVGDGFHYLGFPFATVDLTVTPMGGPPTP